MTDTSAAIAMNVLRRLRDAGFEAYFAGGCVRDLLMGQAPKDFDVATNAQPNQVRGLFKNTQAVGAAFGVILVREGTSIVEVATFRMDLEYRDGRRPEGVTFSTAEQDARRRDFTINGLFFDPVDNRVIDYVGGQIDLQAGKLRAIGNAEQRFAEDHLRMLRAVRFASRFDFEIDTDTARAIQVHMEEIIRISPERIAEELRKMLTAVTRDRAFLLLCQFGFVPMLMRFLPEKTVSGSMKLFLSLTSDRPISFGLALAAIVVDFRMSSTGKFDLHHWLAVVEIKRAAQVMRQTLKISNEESAEMIWSMSFIHLLDEAPPSVAKLKRFLNQPYSQDATTLMSALAKIGMLSDRMTSVLTSLDRWRETEYAPGPLITGDDLTATGAMPGPKFKLALDAAYDAQLEGKIATKEEAMALSMQLLS